jgi:hypothetical protein
MNKIQNHPAWLKVPFWLTATYLGLVVGLVLPGLMTAFFMSRPLLFDSPQGTTILLLIVGLVSFVSICLLGYVIGTAQWIMVQRIIGQKAKQWVIATILGYLLLALVGFARQNLEVTGLWWKFILSAFTGSLLGLSQWFVLRKLINKSAAWIGISLLCWAIPDLVLDNLPKQIFQQTIYHLLMLNPALLSMFFGTIISALALKWFISRDRSRGFDSNSVPRAA